MGMVHACQKYGKCASKQVEDMAGKMKDKDAEDFAKTKHKGLPEKKVSEHLQFEEWFKSRDPQLFDEVSTTTADVALFKRVAIPSFRRGNFGYAKDDFFDKKNKEKD